MSRGWINLRFEAIYAGQFGAEGQALRKQARKTEQRLKKQGIDMIDRWRQLVHQEGDRLLALVKQHAPKKTGELARGLRVDYLTTDNLGGISARIQRWDDHPPDLLKWITQGTRPHRIPRDAPIDYGPYDVIQDTGPSKPRKVLRFYWENGPKGPGTYFFHHVNHPGTKPNPFIDRAITEWLPGAEKAMDEIAHRAEASLSL